jgi:dynein heavy chain
MTGMMTIVIEAEDLSYCTPATISRCGMIYMKDDIIPLKAHINTWLKSLPPVLDDCISELDSLCNYFIPEIIDNYMLQ